ncbi:5,10-methylenetetrahydrofolate reductase [Candidatus Termititenax dinenymphae]|uniref:Methylenetetrahydrofolate reductase n=1 Tax=Candidatus Termititenax dinenymphae TaxID=2218523 RepID=A0A388TKL2_9BACT|nr:5,10-methylenetetrahydrofolate reductase [Candidatus Termititenax dinenymphae]
MKLAEIYSQNKPVISFEVFPPKTDDGLAPLIAELRKLKEFKPGLISVTYGAGGTTQGRSLKLLEKIVNELKLELMPHLTCIGSGEKSILNFLQKISGWGVENILALRGDFPKNNPDYQPESDVFKHAADLVKFTKQNAALSMAVAGFPEKHPEAVSLETDLQYLQAKVHAGAEAIFTQLFFDNQYYYDYMKSVRATGITVPVIPGIWTITNLKQIQKTADLSHAKIPDDLLNKLQKADEAEVPEIGIEYAAAQIQDLLTHGVPGVHLYTLNKAETVSRVLEKIHWINI